jgi:hypothetical protein
LAGFPGALSRAALRSQDRRRKASEKAAIGEVRINPFIYTFEVKDLRMDEANGQAYSRVQTTLCRL